MRELSRREFIILLLIPGLLIAGIYYFAIEGSAQAVLIRAKQGSAELRRSISRLDQSIANARNVPIPPVVRAKEEEALLTVQVAKEKRLIALNAHPGAMLPIHWTTPTGRIEAMQVIESTFNKNGLTVVSREKENESAKELPRELADFATAVQLDGNHPVPEVWRINFVGSYTNVLAALHILGQGNEFIIPLAVGMTTLPQDTTTRIWSLWIWI